MLGPNGKLRICTDPIKVLESPEIEMLRFPGHGNLEKVICPGKPWKSFGILK